MNVAVSVALFVFTTFTDAFKGCMRVLGLGPYSFGASLGIIAIAKALFKGVLCFAALGPNRFNIVPSSRAYIRGYDV